LSLLGLAVAKVLGHVSHPHHKNSETRHQDRVGARKEKPHQEDRQGGPQNGSDEKNVESVHGRISLSLDLILYKLEAFICKAFKGEAIVCYCEPLITLQIKVSGLPDLLSRAESEAQRVKIDEKI